MVHWPCSFYLSFTRYQDTHVLLCSLDSLERAEYHGQGKPSGQQACSEAILHTSRVAGSCGWLLSTCL